MAADEAQPLLHSDFSPRGDAENRQGHDEHHATSKHVVRKIDRHLIPILFVTYMLNFMDKTILSSASVFGLREDTNLRGQDYSWVSGIFYLGYLAWTYPTSYLIARLPVAKYVTANTFFWGLVVAATAACTDYTGLLIVRFLLGMAEATITPAFMFVTSTWYTRDEIPERTGLWFAGNSAGGMAASLLAFGIARLAGDAGQESQVYHHRQTSTTDDHGSTHHPWRYMYGVLGTATFLWGFALHALLPDTISTARFLTPAERRAASARVALLAGTDTGRTEGDTAAARRRWAHQARECLVDPKTWFLVAIEFAAQVPNGGAQNFANIIVTSLGFTGPQSALLNVPFSLVSAAWIYGTGWLAGGGGGGIRRGRTGDGDDDGWDRSSHGGDGGDGGRGNACVLIAAVVAPCAVGAAVIYARESVPSRAAHLAAYFLLASGPAAMPLVMSLAQANYRGVGKKMTVSALLFGAYCAGNLAGPQFFRDDEAPRYETAFRAMVVCYALVAGLAVGLRGYLVWVNRRREMEEGDDGVEAGGSSFLPGLLTGCRMTWGVVRDEGEDGDNGERESLGSEDRDGDERAADERANGTGKVDLESEVYQYLTDWEVPGFRYRL